MAKDRKRLAAALAYIDEKAKRLTSLDQPQESDTVDMALEMGGSFIPGVGQALAARDLERARRADDEAGMAMAAASALPLGRLAGALKRYDPVMSNIDVYRGAETAEIKPRDFPGVFVSKDQAIAKQYGKVHQFDLDESARILPLESSETQKLTQEFFKKYPEAEDFINDPDDPAELFMFPTEEWATFLSEKGYDGTSIGDDIFVKNLKKLKGKQK
jgi:hypothetical protein